jgi:GGDEF domain-containing protein
VRGVLDRLIGGIRRSGTDLCGPELAPHVEASNLGAMVGVGGSAAFHVACVASGAPITAFVAAAGIPTGSISVTASIGVVSLVAGEDLTFEAMLARADAAMYEAKRAGRNRVTAWKPAA